MLKLPTTVRYGTRIVVFLAVHGRNDPVSTAEIAEAEGISQSYTEQILLKLRAADIVRSRRGPGGGYLLAGDPEELTVADILTALDGPIALATCHSRKCLRQSDCVTRPVWEKANEAVSSVFSGINIAQLAQQAKEIEYSSTPDYQI